MMWHRDIEALVKLFADAYIQFPGLWERERVQRGDGEDGPGIEVKTSTNGEIKNTTRKL
jgi:hypothetical protein